MKRSRLVFTITDKCAAIRGGGKIEISPDYLVALDAAGRIVGHNCAARLPLEAEHGSTVLGLPFDQLFNARFGELGLFLRAMPGGRSAVTLARSARVLFLHAVPPPARGETQRVAAQPAPQVQVPEALARLSAATWRATARSCVPRASSTPPSAC